MSGSKVYFTNLRAKPSQNLLKKLEALIVKAGIDKIDFDRKIVALKIHFGEPGLDHAVSIGLGNREYELINL